MNISHTCEFHDRIDVTWPTNITRSYQNEFYKALLNQKHTCTVAVCCDSSAFSQDAGCILFTTINCVEGTFCFKQPPWHKIGCFGKKKYHFSPGVGNCSHEIEMPSLTCVIRLHWLVSFVLSRHVFNSGRNHFSCVFTRWMEMLHCCEVFLIWAEKRTTCHEWECYWFPHFVPQFFENDICFLFSIVNAYTCLSWMGMLLEKRTPGMNGNATGSSLCTSILWEWHMLPLFHCQCIHMPVMNGNVTGFLHFVPQFFENDICFLSVGNLWAIPLSLHKTTTLEESGPHDLYKGKLQYHVFFSHFTIVQWLAIQLF